MRWRRRAAALIAGLALLSGGCGDTAGVGSGANASAVAVDPQGTSYRQATVLRQQASSLASTADRAAKGVDVINNLRSAVSTCKAVPAKGYKATATLADRWPPTLRELDTALAAACGIVSRRAGTMKLADDSGWQALASSVAKTVSAALRPVPAYTEEQFRALLGSGSGK